jgi:hypothetical protein
MNCRKVRLCLFSYFKNELSEKEKAEIKLHLEGCPDCAKESVEVERIASLVKDSLETLTPSPDFNQKLLSQIQKLSSGTVKEVTRPSFPPVRIRRLVTAGFSLRLFSPVRVKWALAGSFMVIILASVLWFTQKQTPISPEPISKGSKGTESPRLVNQQERADSLYREMLKRLMAESRVQTKTFVLDNFRLVGSRGIDGMEKPEDIYKRFIIETAGPGVDEKRMGSHYVLPVVSTQQASEKVNY